MKITLISKKKKLLNIYEFRGRKVQQSVSYIGIIIGFLLCLTVNKMKKKWFSDEKIAWFLNDLFSCLFLILKMWECEIYSFLRVLQDADDG